MVDEIFPLFLEQRKYFKMQWVQDTDQRNVDNLNNERCEASRHFIRKKD
jgi:hypothetical protein